MIEVFMPKAGMDMQEGRVIRWLKEVGDSVELDEPIMEIETDKITMEAEAPGSGILLAKLVPDDTVVPVLQTIGYIGEEGEQVPETDAQAESAAPAQAKQPTEASAPVAGQKLSSGGGVAATPYAKTLANENGIDLQSVTPTGRRGEVTGADIEAALSSGGMAKATPLARRIAEDTGAVVSSIDGSGHAGKVTKADVLSASKPAIVPAEGERVPMNAMRRVIAERMSRSHAEIPVVTQHMKVYVDELLDLRRKVNAKGAKVSINDFVIKAVAKAVREFPIARTIVDGTDYITMDGVNIGFAVGMDGGLLVPVIRDADKLPLSEISAVAKDLASRARDGKLKPDELKGGVFTISNMGMFDVFAFTPIINQPEPGILGVGAINKELALVGGEVTERSYVMISLTFDHRIMDGVSSAQFQLRVKELMEDPLSAVI